MKLVKLEDYEKLRNATMELMGLSEDSLSDPTIERSFGGMFDLLTDGESFNDALAVLKTFPEIKK